MPCKNATRSSMEAAKEYYRKERELDKSCPYRALWRTLVDRVYSSNGGFESLNDSEKIYYAVKVLVGEVYNGGLSQYFTNSSGDNYMYAELGLINLQAKESLRILRTAKEGVFGRNRVPTDRVQRCKPLIEGKFDSLLDALDSEFYKDPDNLGERLDNYALENGLLKNA